MMTSHSTDKLAIIQSILMALASQAGRIHVLRIDWKNIQSNGEDIAVPVVEVILK